MGIRYYSHTGVNTEYLFLSFPSLGYFLHTHVLVSTLINILGIQLVYIWTFYYVQLFLSLPLSTQSLNSVFTNQKIFWVPFWFLSFQLGNCLEAGGAIKCLCHVLPFLRDYFPSFYNTQFQKPIASYILSIFFYVISCGRVILKPCYSILKDVRKLFIWVFFGRASRQKNYFLEE